jgi:hypothetical protein
MLAADHDILLANMRHMQANITQKEMDLFVSNFQTIASQSAVLAGFCLSGLTMDPVPWNPENEDGTSAQMHRVHEALFATGTAMSMALNLIALCTATFAVMYGPKLALRGPRGSMAKAVAGMRSEHSFCVICNQLGTVAFILSAVPLSLLKVLVFVFVFVCFARACADFQRAVVLSGAVPFRGEHVQHRHGVCRPFHDPPPHQGT